MIRVGLIVMGGLLVGALSTPPPKVADRVTLEVVPNPLVLRVLGRSQINFVADLFWVRMANMGGRVETADECAALLPIANLIADLDPRFKYPYFMGGVLAPFKDQKTGQYVNHTGAISLMGRGISSVPEYIRLYVNKAYSELVMLHDPIAAGQTLLLGTKRPDAPAHFGTLASRLLAQGGRYADARAFVQSMMNAEDPDVREEYALRAKQIDLEEILTRVDAAVAEFKTQQGRSPADVNELVAKGLLPALPIDPFGGAIILTEAGAESTASKGRLRAYLQGDE